MRPLAARWLVLLLLSTPAEAAGILVKLTGSVMDGPGDPAVFARVIAVDQGGLALERFPTKTGLRGQYSIDARTTVASLIFVDRDGARIAEIKGPWTRDARVDLDFRAVRYFTLYGQLVEEKSGMKDLGRELRRGFPSARSRKIRVKVHAGHLELAAVEPDESGKFRFRSNLPITHLTTAAFGETPTRVDGPWKSDAVVNVIHSRGSVFSIKGRVLDQHGRPRTRILVNAEDARGLRVIAARTDESGAFLLRCERPVALLRCSIKGRKLELRGPWSRHVDVVLREGANDRDGTHSDELSEPPPVSSTTSALSGFVLRGTVTDDKGRDLKGVRITALGRDDRTLASTRTDADGHYKLVVKRPATQIRAERRGYGKESPRGSRSRRGQWTDDARIDFLFPAQAEFQLTGRVLSRSGVAVPSVRVDAYTTSHRAVDTTWTDSEGRFWFTVKTPIARVSARKPSGSHTTRGPWAEDAALEVRVSDSFIRAPGWSSKTGTSSSPYRRTRSRR